MFSRNDRSGRSGGGTLAFVRDGIPYKTWTDLRSNIESTVIQITEVTLLGPFSHLLCC
jgi:hypothetical protein